MNHIQRVIDSYKYHPVTGKPLKHERANKKVDSDGTPYYVVGVPCANYLLVNEDKEFLLTRRAIEPFKGTWDIHGGFLSLGETHEEARVREIQEEVGLHVIDDNLIYVGSYIDYYPYKDLYYEVNCVLYLVTVSNNCKLTQADDVAEARFFETEDIPFGEIKFLGAEKMVEDTYKKII